MGAQRSTDGTGGGRKPGPASRTRSEPVRVMLTPSEREDLATLASGWGVPVGTAAYALVGRELARFRGYRGDLGDAGAAIRAGMRSLAVRESGDAEPGP